MGRTTLRTANTSDVTDISESFANFASYTGINEDKSFIGTDQNSFEESNNMYVDVNGQLSTRPPVETHTISVLDGASISDVFKVNGITFYKYYKTNYVEGSTVDVTSKITQTINGQVTEDGSATEYINVDYSTYNVFDYNVIITISWAVGYADSNMTTTAFSGTTTTTLAAGDKLVSTDVAITSLPALQQAYGDNLWYTITFTAYYVTGAGYQNYHISWKYNDEWQTVTSAKEYDVKYVQGYYVFYNETTLIAYKYNGSSWTEYSLADIIYIPVTEARSGSTVQEGMSANVLTTAYIITYLLEPNNGIVTDTSDIIGKTVTITIDDEEYTLTWAIDTDVMLTKTYGIISATVTKVISAKPDDSDILLVAYRNHWRITYDGETVPGCYYSVDGNLWTSIVFPTNDNTTNFNACLSENSNYLWVQYADMDDDYNMKLYYYVLPYTIISASAYLSYNTLTYSAFEQYGYNAGDSDTDGGSYSYLIKDFAIDSTFMPIMHSVDAGQCILLIEGTLTVTTYYYDSTSYSYSTSTYTSTTTNTASNIGNLIVVNSLSATAYCGGNISHLTSNTSDENTAQIRFYPTYDSIQYANIYYMYNYSGGKGSGQYMLIMPIALDENCVPYYHFNVSSISSIGKSVFHNVGGTAIMTQIGGAESYVGSVITVDMDDTFTSFDNIDIWEHTQDGVITYHLAFSLSSTDDVNVAFLSDGYTNGDFYITITAEYGTISGYNSNYVSLTTTQDDYTVYYYNYSTSNASTVNATRTAVNWTVNSISYSVTQLQSTDDVSTYFRLYKNTDGVRILTDKYYYVNSNVYTYLTIDGGTSDYRVPIAIISATSEVDNETTLYYFYYWLTNNYKIYTNNYGSATIEYLVTADGGTEINNNDYNYLSMDFTAELLTTTIASGNCLYQASGTDDDKLYIPKDSKVELPDNITGLIEFSQTVLGVFLPYTAYEYTVSSSDDGGAYYYLYPTKLVIGNRADYDLLQSYDGSSIYISTVKGVATLTYEELVQSTEHVFTYLTDNILGAYKEFDISAIKFCQYLNWLFMYRQDSNICYLYDISNSAWWKWTLPDNITKIYWDTENDVLIVLMSNVLYYFNFDTDDFYDYGTKVINWNFKSQKLHLSAPNNYKHIRRISIVTTQNTEKMRYKLKFTNYKSWERLQDKYVVEYDIDNLNTLIQKVNFMKCNAFQFEISNDTTWSNPQKFVVSNIAIKYRVTEDIR